MSRIADLIEKLNDNASTVIDIPGKDGEDRRYNTRLIKKAAKSFELLFPPSSWKAEEFELGVGCHLAIKHKDITINLVAELDAIVNERRMAFIAKEAVSPESLREFFRVSINIEVQASYNPGPKEVKTKKWTMLGSTIDLSASGVLGLFPEKPANERRIDLDINLPEPYGPVRCPATVIRSYRLRKNRYQVAFHFDEINTKTKDLLISCCLHEQRRQLRDNVEVD